MMAGKASDDISRAIGQLEGAVEALTKSVSAQSAESSRARGKMYDAIADIKDTVTRMDHRLTSLEEKVSAITPETEEFTQWRLRAQGAGMLGKVLWFAGGFLLSAAATLAGAWHWFAGKAP